MRLKYCPIPDFDEGTYLALNPEIEAYLQDVEFSPWEQFVSTGYINGRKGGPDPLDRRFKAMLDDTDPLPVPPEHLRRRVHGADVDSFRTIGRLVAANLLAAIEESRIRLPRNARVLDFGCGSGRVLSMLRYLLEDGRFHGTDIDVEAISWCQQHLSRAATFSANAERPPMAQVDEYFDLVYSVSVFTHLPERMHFQWLDELRRITRKGGYLLLSVHGPDLFPAHLHEGRRMLEEKGFLYGGGEGTEGLPQFYKAAYHLEPYIRREWGRRFDILRIIPRAIAGRQDLVVCRRPTAAQELWRKILMKKA